MKYLKKLLEEYSSMPFEINIVVLSNISKDLGPDIEVMVGLPTKDPRSLPIGHKRFFADKVNDYDLFIYTEDDILITEKNIRSFLEVTKILPDNEIAGFTLYETYSEGKIYYCSIFGKYHWDPKSVKTYGEYTFAYLTNEHSASYLLTQKQLKKAIDSGGFLINPRKPRYYSLETLVVTAGKDPYARCGFNKMICISHIENFRLHHLPNNVMGRNQLTENSVINQQINALMKINDEGKFKSELFDTRTKFVTTLWAKNYYELCRSDIISLIPKEVKSILSVGCGYGATEITLYEQGFSVTAIPIDSIISSTMKEKGVEVICPDFEKALQVLNNRRFDCIIFSNILQYLQDPVNIIKQFRKLLRKEGFIIASVPNLNHVSVWKKRLSKKSIFKELKEINYEKSGLHFTTQKKLKFWIKNSEFKIIKFNKNYNNNNYLIVNKFLFNMISEILAIDITILGKKT